MPLTPIDEPAATEEPSWAEGLPMPDSPPIDDAAIREEPAYLEREGRNAFYESLAPDAKDRFLRSLRLASARGLDEATAWEEAVVAAETTYTGTPPDDRLPRADENL